jgi:hypothetical protein
LLCEAIAVDLEDAASDEFDRISRPEVMAKIQAKNATKPKFSPLPGAVQ